ncbi:MAG: hypothetical protein LUH18_00760 [Oscillospiraceae bacterium]|nr:hypothetical protein [Oscillospiraceae bacterium]
MDSRELSMSLLDALNDIDDKYIAHAGQVKPRRMVSLRSVLIAAVVAMLAVVSAIAVYSSKSYSYDRYQEPTDDPVESVLNLIENKSLKSHVIEFEIYGAAVDEEETARVLSEETELVKEQEWNEDNFVVVYAEYYQIFYKVLSEEDDGYQADWFWMEYDPVNDIWVLYDNSEIGDYSPGYLGLFDETGVGHEDWCKDDVGSYNAALAYLEGLASEDYINNIEIIGCESDDEKIDSVMSSSYTLTNTRVWYNYYAIRVYNFTVYYTEYYVDYDESLTDLEDGYYAVWLWMEKNDDTGVWSCYYADTDQPFEYIFISYSEIESDDTQPDEDAISAATSWLEETYNSGITIYGAEVDYDQTRTVLRFNSFTVYLRGWNLGADKNFLVVYVEYSLDDADKAVYVWVEKDAETEEWSYYYSVETHPGDLYA